MRTTEGISASTKTEAKIAKERASKKQQQKTKRPKDEVDKLLVRAARSMMKTAFEQHEKRDEVAELRKAWGKRVSGARKELNNLLDALGDTVIADANSLCAARIDALLVNVRRRNANKAQRDALTQSTAEATRAIVNAIEEGLPKGAVDGDAETEALRLLMSAWQSLQEETAGRKQAMHLALTELEELEAKREKQIEGARQLSLFD